MRMVVKVGTSTLAHATGRLNIRHVEELVKVLSDLKNAGHEMILVSSGAIGMGVGKLNLPGRPDDMPTKQAAAAVGQCELMYTYDKGGLLDQLYREARVEKVEYGETIEVTALCTPKTLGQLGDYLSEPER